MLQVIEYLQIGNGIFHFVVVCNRVFWYGSRTR